MPAKENRVEDEEQEAETRTAETVLLMKSDQNIGTGSVFPKKRRSVLKKLLEGLFGCFCSPCNK